MWMLRVHYYSGPMMEFNHCNKEITCLDSYVMAIINRDSALRNGILTRNASEPFYEYWVAPSQIIGFEIIEYEGEDEN